MFLALFIRHVWAEKLLAHIMEPRWTLMWMFRIVRGQCTEADYNREMNALFVKIHLLDPQVVIPAFQFLLNQKGTAFNITVELSFVDTPYPLIISLNESVLILESAKAWFNENKNINDSPINRRRNNYVWCTTSHYIIVNVNVIRT